MKSLTHGLVVLSVSVMAAVGCGKKEEPAPVVVPDNTNMIEKARQASEEAAQKASAMAAEATESIKDAGTKVKEVVGTSQEATEELIAAGKAATEGVTQTTVVEVQNAARLAQESVDAAVEAAMAKATDVSAEAKEAFNRAEETIRNITTAESP